MAEPTSIHFSDIGRPSEHFSDEASFAGGDANTEADGLSINYDELDNDSTRGSKQSPALKRTGTEDRPMIGQDKISSTSRWNVIVIVLMLVNTTIVVLATSLYLNHETDQEFQRAVSKKGRVMNISLWSLPSSCLFAPIV